jgi:hypothetical protein
MSPMRLLRFHDGGSRDRMGYQQVVHFGNLQTADFISNPTHSVESRILAPRARFELATLRLTASRVILSKLAGIGLNRRQSASCDETE